MLPPTALDRWSLVTIYATPWAVALACLMRGLLRLRKLLANVPNRSRQAEFMERVSDRCLKRHL